MNVFAAIASVHFHNIHLLQLQNSATSNSPETSFTQKLVDPLFPLNFSNIQFNLLLKNKRK